MALMNEGYLKGTLNGLIGTKVPAVTANSREARDMTPYNVVTRVCAGVKESDVEDILLDVLDEVRYADSDVWAAEINSRKVNNRYIITVVLAFDNEQHKTEDEEKNNA